MWQIVNNNEARCGVFRCFVLFFRVFVFFFYSGLEIFQDEARIQVAQTFLSSSTEAKTNNKGALYDTGKFFNPAFYSWPNCRHK